MSEWPAVLSLAVVATVEKPERDASFRESVRDGRRKKIFENPEPEHHFHLEYQLLPEGAGAQVFKTDVVSFGVVSKVYTERDTRVVHCWEDGHRTLSSFGWRHKHSVKVTKALLLQLYKHTLELRIWNTKSKLSARARYDRPKAFRLPAASKSSHEEVSAGPLSKRPSKLCVVSQEQAKTTAGRSKRGKQSSSLSLHADTDSETSVCEQPVSPALSPRQLEPAIPEEEEEEEEELAHDCSAPTLQSPSGRRRRRPDAVEPARTDTEGLTVLRVNMSHLFARESVASAAMTTPVKNLRGVEVCVSVQDSLMSPELLRELNPLTITVARLTGLPSSPLTHPTLRENCEPVFVRYQFPGHAPHRTSGLAAAESLEWHDSHTVLLGTVPPEQLLQFLRGPPLAMELHDRQPKSVSSTPPAVFGQESQDLSIGTHALRTRLTEAGSGVVEACSSRAPHGLAQVDLTGLLAGQKVIEVSSPVVNGPKPVGVVTTPPGNYLESQCELVVRAELAHPLSLPLPSKHTTTTFNRLVYLVSAQGKPLLERVLAMVNEGNARVLHLEHLPAHLLSCALSTYKLTREELSGDVITGFHVQDSDWSLLVLEGLRGGAVHRLWAELPRHPSQDARLLKVFYNSQYAFCERLYGSLDVDLPCIQLFQPLATLLQSSLLYISGGLPPHCFRALMCLSELSVVGEMADLTRTGLLPSAQEVAALSLHFGLPVTHQTTHEHSPDPTHPTPPPDHVPTQSKRVWQPLELSNSLYEKFLRDKKTERPDFVHRNILHVAELSKQSLLSRPRRRRCRALSDSGQHVYSSQTYNCHLLADARLRRQLDPRRRYTYCQDYHSMTLEPSCSSTPDEMEPPGGERSGFQYPGVASSMQCNTHKSRPHPTRVEQLKEPFLDNLLHANTLKPSVDRLHFSWQQRSEDFERYQRPPAPPCLPPPPSIHLAGQSRARELHSSTALAEQQWQQRVVVADTHFHVHRQGLRAEQAARGAKASSQLDRLRDILKDPAHKYALKRQGLALESIPALSVLPAEQSRSDGGRGYYPGAASGRSLRLDCNAIPIIPHHRPPTVAVAGHQAETQLLQ